MSRAVEMQSLPPMPLISLKGKIRNDSNHQSRAQERRAPPVVKLGRLTGTNRPASIDVRPNRIQEGRNSYKGEYPRDNERKSARLGAEVKKGCGNGANVNGELELMRVSMRVYTGSVS